MFAGIKFMPTNFILADKKIAMFKYYTVDSNILMGIVSLIMLIYEYLYIKKKKFIPKFVFILKFIGTTTISLTFITTLVFLTPKLGFYNLYNNSNLFFHLIVPLLAIISYVFFERYDSKYRESLLGIVPMLIYAVYYISNVFIHYDIKYDFYGFLNGDFNNAFIAVPIIIIVTYLMGLFMLFVNKKCNK